MESFISLVWELIRGMKGCGDSCATNIGDTVRYCRKHIHPSRLKGYQVSIWRYTTPEYDQRHFDAIDQLAAAL